MSTATSTKSNVEIASSAGSRTADSGFKMGPFLSWLSVRVTLILICILWILPVIGLFVTSFRDARAIRTSGWWTALSPSVQQLTQPNFTGDAPTNTYEGASVAQLELFDSGRETNVTEATFPTFGDVTLEAGDFYLDEDTGVRLTVNDDGEITYFTYDTYDQSIDVNLAIELGNSRSLGDEPVQELTGNFMEDIENVTLTGFGLGNDPSTALGETIEDGDITFTVNEDGTYTYTSAEAFDEVQNISIRVQIPADAMVTQDIYEVTGNLYEGGEGREISRFGLTQSFGANTTTGNMAISANQDTYVTVQEDGTYTLLSLEPVEEAEEVYLAVQQPPVFTLDNYDTVLNGNPALDIDDSVGQSFLTTLVVTVPATIIPISIAAFASYAFSWMQFGGRRFFFIIVVALLVVPLQLALIPVQRIYNSVELTGTFPGIWLAHTAFGLPLAIYLLSNYIGGLPREIIESAQIDGATHFQIFVRLVLPLSVPALASFAIFQFLWVWNDLLVARVFLGRDDDMQVLTSTIKGMTGTYGNNWEVLTAAAFISMILPLLVFFSLQRYFVRGLLAGSVKGG